MYVTANRETIDVLTFLDINFSHYLIWKDFPVLSLGIIAPGGGVQCVAESDAEQGT
jgi:hypothetical protein